MTLADRIAGRGVCICTGAGGVGKTTVSAAVAIGLAARGARVAVVTIDPARRLADVLAAGGLGNEPQQIELAGLAAAPTAPAGELWAMMLDAKRTIDDLIAVLAPDTATREAIADNRVYRELSGALAGAQEFAAIAKVHELIASERFDVVVLDTPPSRDALAFLDAPGRLSGFLAERPLDRVAALARAGGRAGVRRGGAMVGALRRLTGLELLSDVGRFLGLVDAIAGGLAQHTRQVESVLAHPSTGFLVVATPQPAAVEEAVAMRARLTDRGMSYAGLIVNRVLVPLPHAPPTDPAAVGGDADLGARALDAWRELHTRATEDAMHLRRLTSRIGDDDPFLVPRIAAGASDRDGLMHVQRCLFATNGERPGLLAAASF